mmetsp:Transcript_19644/g.34874  ORF Transcript_19644/g.34874 Transcript_19644/m.34874 type:complete len:254 (-) Transcript_19644:143-904(-)
MHRRCHAVGVHLLEDLQRLAILLLLGVGGDQRVVRHHVGDLPGLDHVRERLDHPRPVPQLHVGVEDDVPRRVPGDEALRGHVRLQGQHHPKLPRPVGGHEQGVEQRRGAPHPRGLHHPVCLGGEPQAAPLREGPHKDLPLRRGQYLGFLPRLELAVHADSGGDHDGPFQGLDDAPVRGRVLGLVLLAHQLLHCLQGEGPLVGPVVPLDHGVPGVGVGGQLRACPERVPDHSGLRPVAGLDAQADDVVDGGQLR